MLGYKRRIRRSAIGDLGDAQTDCSRTMPLRTIGSGRNGPRRANQSDGITFSQGR